MKLDDLLTDTTGCAIGTSRRVRIRKLVAMLNEAHGGDSVSFKGVEKWFDRKTIPGPWLMKIAALRKPPLNLSRYS